MNPSPAPVAFRAAFNTPLARLVGIGLMLLVLLIPACAIREVVHERDSRRQEAVADIVGKWGGAQTVIGPILRVPFVTRHLRKDAQGKAVEDVVPDVAYFLPASLKANGEATTELRRRGIFEVPVYVASLELQGRFAGPDWNGWGVRPEDVDWKRAELMLGLSQPRALQADASLHWNGQPQTLRPSTGLAGEWHPAGVHAAFTDAQGSVVGKDGAEFRLKLRFNGAESLSFSPTAEDSQVALRANWPHPSFQGSWLPANRSLEEQGFSADWSVSYLGRDYPQRWRESAAVAEAIGKTSFGVSFTTPVDHYRMAERITKYAVMTLVFTFTVIWLTEILAGARVHLIQYGFTGAALCLFGLLQLSFAEHFGFNLAFFAAAAGVVTMVTLYTRAVLGSVRRALGVGGVLAGLYGYLYMILRAEDYALLGGSLALFAGLAVAMYLTRRIDWSAATTTAENK